MVVLAKTALSPEQSVRKIASDIVLSKSHVHHIKQYNKFNLYKNFMVMIQITRLNFVGDLSHKESKQMISY